MSHTQASCRVMSKIGVAVLVADLQVELVGQIKAALGLDRILEHPEHVRVLLVELQLNLGLVALEVLGAHCPSSSGRSFVIAGDRLPTARPRP